MVDFDLSIVVKVVANIEWNQNGQSIVLVGGRRGVFS